jgi:2-oxo-4-hydroxy-4-carboxy-5-ureidoimidazoline decarboxylase
MLLREFNQLPTSDALQQMLACCHCNKWAQLMVQGRPYAAVQDVLISAQQHWALMQEAEWLEAFSGHARIGDLAKLRDKYSRAHAEQGQVALAEEGVLQALWQLNQQYETKHGFIFIVCASGKSASEMLSLLQQRLPHSTVDELRTAAAEQAKITAIRLRELTQ